VAGLAGGRAPLRVRAQAKCAPAPAGDEQGNGRAGRQNGKPIPPTSSTCDPDGRTNRFLRSTTSAGPARACGALLRPGRVLQVPDGRRTILQQPDKARHRPRDLLPFHNGTPRNGFLTRRTPGGPAPQMDPVGTQAGAANQRAVEQLDPPPRDRADDGATSPGNGTAVNTTAGWLGTRSPSATATHQSILGGDEPKTGVFFWERGTFVRTSRPNRRITPCDVTKRHQP